MNSTDTSTDQQRLIIIGNGMVGHHCVEQLIERGALAQYRVHVFSEEPLRAYDRVHLSEYFTGRDAESLALSGAELYQTPGVTLHLGVPVLEIDRERREVITAEGSFPYDQLVLASGSYPFVPPIEGAEGDSRLVYRTLADLDTIQAAAKSARRGVVVGGGLLGLEAANALKSLGLEAHVVEFAPRLMPVQLDDHGGLALKAQIEALGVSVHLSRGTQSITPGSEYRYRMNFAGEEFLETDLIVFSAGIRPQDAIAKQCGLELGPRGGVAIDSQCRTSDPAIYAIGECAAWNGGIFGLVAPGYQMARSVATQLCGEDSEPFMGADMSTKLKLLGVDVGSIGDAHGATAGSRSYRFIDEANAAYRRLVVDASGKHVLGAVLVGDNSYYDTLLQYAQNGIALPADPAALILPQTGGAPALGADALPDSATICSCHNVTKGSICSAIDGGCTDLGLLKSQTKACTGCGGCAGLLIGGLAVGAASVMAPAYISEVAPARYRGMLTTVQQIAIIFGLFMAFISNYLLAKFAGASTSVLWLDYSAWRWMFWMELLPAVLFLLMLLFIPESPRFLVLKGKTALAAQVLRKLYGDAAAARKQVDIEQSLSSNHQPRLSDLIDKPSGKLRRVVWVGIGLATFQQLVGINVVFYYGAVLWQAVGFSESDALLINVISGALSIAACVITLLVIDKIGRKPLLKWGSVGMSLTLALMVLAFANAEQDASGRLLLGDWGIVALISANAYVFFFNMSWGPVMWVMLGEMFPNQIRGSGLAVSGLAQWGSNFLITMTFPLLLSGIGLAGAYGLYTLGAVLSVWFVVRMVHETKGKELEDMPG